MVFWLLLFVGFGVGISKGGQFNIVLELRPWILLSAGYLLRPPFSRAETAFEQ